MFVRAGTTFNLYPRTQTLLNYANPTMSASLFLRLVHPDDTPPIVCQVGTTNDKPIDHNSIGLCQTFPPFSHETPANAHNFPVIFP